MSKSSKGGASQGGNSGGGGKNTANHSNQCNPNNSNHQGYSGSYKGSTNQGSLNNHSNQMNPNNAASNAPKKWSSSIPKIINLLSLFGSYKYNCLSFVIFDNKQNNRINLG